jgi:TonB-dependent receptor
MKRLNSLRTSASFIALSAAVFAAGHASAQAPAQATDVDEIVVTGFRASIEEAIEIKRSQSGVVDAIVAEDIGKFPDTNLAESLQRIPGVAIDRRNGEGEEVTVRGFGGGFNLVTLNGRTMPTANVQTVGGDQNADFAGGTSRSFDFSNLASEGVGALEVYKTGRAAIPSGGIGASINVRTRRPLDAEEGLSGSIGVKALYDTSVEESQRDATKITPEVSGLLNWTDPNEVFGVTVFGSYQKRNFTTRSSTVNDWNIRRYADFLNPSNGFVRSNNGTQITNGPSDPNTLVAIPNDSRYHLSEGQRERMNGQVTLQWQPVENVVITADALYARNKANEHRSDQGNWFNRPFDRVTFDDNPVVATAVFLSETLSGTKDAGFEQQYRANTDTLESYALNGSWAVNERLTLSLDGHISRANSKPGAGNGASSTMVSIGAPVISGHSVDFTGTIPVQSITVNDAAPRGNGNGRLDAGDLGSQVARTFSQRQSQEIKELRFDGAWDLDDSGSRFEFGANYRDSEMRQSNINTQQDLGSWGILNPRDVSQYAGNLVQEFCLACAFNELDPGQSGSGLIAFRADPLALYDALSTAYLARGNPISITGQNDNRVQEKILAAYGQLTWKGQIADRDASMVAGIRYERTKVDSTSLIRTPRAVVWTADNDFSVATTATFEPIEGAGKYNNLLPALDFQIEVMEDVVARASFSRTIARPDYGNLFAAVTAQAPNRPIANGAVALGTSGNPDLEPLISDNFDVSLEWYYKPGSFVSAALFEKRVNNFVGTGTVMRNLFGLRDPSSGQAGTRSGQARQLLTDVGADQTDVNLFTATALIIQNGGNVAAAQSQFQANRQALPSGGLGDLNQGFVDQILATMDIEANASDPLFNFQVAQPINNRSAKIWGFEVAGTHFFGETGFGIAGAYTFVDGDVGFDVGADPGQDQFALLGLSDTANVTLIYEKYGFSARLTWNWRDKFLAATNRGGSRNPVFVEAFDQVDVNVSYDVNENIAVSFEGINLFKEHLRTHARDENQLWFAQELDTRYLLGVRYKF